MTRRTLRASARVAALVVTGLLGVTSCATLGLEHPPTARPAAPTVEQSSAKPTAAGRLARPHRRAGA